MKLQKDLNDVCQALERLDTRLEMTNFHLKSILDHLNWTKEHHFANRLEWKIGQHLGDLNRNMKGALDILMTIERNTQR